MKYLPLLFATGLLILSSCGDEVLDRTPQGEITLENFFQNEIQAEQSVNAIYNQLRSFNVHVFAYIGMTDIVSDDAEKGSIPGDANFLQEIDDFTYTPTNNAPGGVWEGYYTGIFRANLAIDRLPTVPDMEEDLRQRLLAEARFLRAYYYFNLTRWFGDVVLTTDPFPEQQLMSRAPQSEVYDLIVGDFTFAASVLPEKSDYPSGDLGRATRGAAESFLAKVHLTRQDWPEALTFAEGVIESEEYGLLPSYTTIFTEEGENAEESIFEVQAAFFEVGDVGNSRFNLVQGVRGTPNLGWGFNRPSDDLIRAFEPGDPRREATVLYEGEILPDGSGIVIGDANIVNDRYNQKAFVTYPGNIARGPGNIRIFRYADVLLIAAEAANELGMADKALGYVNQVRERARGGSTRFLPDLTTTDQQALREAIWRERRVEFGMEQMRWFDLVRTGRAAAVMQALGKDFEAGKHELFPIPQGDIDLSLGMLSQNPGYVQ